MMFIHKVIDSVEFPVTKQLPDGEIISVSEILLECFGFESEEDEEPTQFSIQTGFPQAYRIMNHMRKPTLEPFIVEIDTGE